MGCRQSLGKSEEGSSKKTQKGAIYVFVPGLRVPIGSKEMAKALQTHAPSKLAHHLVALRTRIEVLAAGEGVAAPASQTHPKPKGMVVQQGSQSPVFCGGTPVTDLQVAIENYLPVLLALAGDEKLSHVAEFCWTNQEDPHQATCIAHTSYELLSILHLMAVLTLSQANFVLTPRPPADSHQPKITEQNKRVAIDALIRAAGVLKYAVSTTLRQMPVYIRKKLPADLAEGTLHALWMQALGQGIDVQLSFALDNSKATLAVKRRLACEQLKCWMQVDESLQVVQLQNTWGMKHNLFVSWKLAEAKAAAYYFHGLILDEGTDANTHAKASTCLQLAESCLTESKKFCAEFCSTSPATMVPPLWGAMKYLSERIPKDATAKTQKYDDALRMQKNGQKLPDLPDFLVALQPEHYTPPVPDSSWTVQMLNSSQEDQQGGLK